jgi:xanthine dehydrogenase YagS FAD-binding subunit
MNGFEWTSPHDIAEAAAAGTGTATVASAMVSRSGKPSSASAVFKAGGIDLLDLMKEGLLTPRRLVNLGAIPDLAVIAQADDGTVRIGANVTLAQLAAEPLIRARYRALADAAGRSASPQIRQVATVGGNLLQRPRCWYFRSRDHHCLRKGGDVCFAFAGENQYHAIFDHNGCAIVHPSTSATALVAFDARLELTGSAANKRIVRLEEFFVLPEVDIQRENDLRPEEMLTAILLPPQPATSRSLHIRQGEIDSFDWPVADVAAVLDLAPNGSCRKAAVILGAAAPVPHRAKAAQAMLIGKAIDEGVARAAAQAALQGAAPLTKNAYKLPIFETLVRRAILGAARSA